MRSHDRDRMSLGFLGRSRSQSPAAAELRSSLASQPFLPSSHPQQTQQQQAIGRSPLHSSRISF